MTTMALPLEVFSPTSIDTEYLTLDHYAWADVTSAKRTSTDIAEGRRRHRENQRRYLLRKRARIDVLQTTVDRMEKQLQLLRATQDAAVLRMDNAVKSAAIELDAHHESLMSPVLFDSSLFDFKLDGGSDA